MPEIRFYHLQKQKVEQALPGLLKKALDGDFKTLVHTSDDAQSKALDKHLWTHHPDSFLPHGTGKDLHPEAQPIWLSAKRDDKPNDPNLLVELDALDLDTLDGYDLVCLMFADWEEDRVKAARASWKSLKDGDNFDLSYWQQTDTGGWEKKQ